MRHLDLHDDGRVVVIEKKSSGIGTFVLGAALGIAVALLFAPQSGAEARRQIKRRAGRVARGAADAAVDRLHGVREKLVEGMDDVREAVGENGRVRRAMDAGRTAAAEARRGLENELSETKAAYRAGARVAREKRRGPVRTTPSTTE